MIAFACSQLDSLAAAFATSRSLVDRARLCEAAIPLVRRAAFAVQRRLPRHFGVEDLVGDGCLGLLRAIDRFDPSFGVSFESWANRIVRGAMLNGLRRMDVIPERVRRNARVLEDARWIVAQSTGAAPRDDEAARVAELTASKLAAVYAASKHAGTLSLDGPIPGAERGTLAERLTAKQRDPGTLVAESSVRVILGGAVASLPGRQRAILEAFYVRGATFGEIGRTLGVSKQRVSQLHCRALTDLRAKLAHLAPEL